MLYSGTAGRLLTSTPEAMILGRLRPGEARIIREAFGAWSPPSADSRFQIYYPRRVAVKPAQAGAVVTASASSDDPLDASCLTTTLSISHGATYILLITCACVRVWCRRAGLGS